MVKLIKVGKKWYSRLVIETEMGKVVYDGRQLNFLNDNIWIDLPECDCEILPIIEFFLKNKEALKKVDEIQDDKHYNSHKEFITKKIYKGIMKNEFDKAIKEIEKLLDKSEKIKIVKDEIERKFINFGSYWEYFKTEKNGNTVVFIRWADATQKVIYVLIIGKDRIEMGKTKSYTTIYKILKENELKIGRLMKINRDDIQFLKQNEVLTLLKGLFYDMDEETKKKFNNFLTIYSLE
jgi:hypothetical protein